MKKKTGRSAKLNQRRPRLVNKPLSLADLIRSQNCAREAKFNAMISNISSGLVDEFLEEECLKIARRLAAIHNIKCESDLIARGMGSKCKLCNAISGSEYVILLDRQLTGRKLYQLARRALGLMPNADSTSVLLTFGGIEVPSNDYLCYNRFAGHHIQYVLHK